MFYLKSFHTGDIRLSNTKIPSTGYSKKEKKRRNKQQQKSALEMLESVVKRSEFVHARE